MANLGYIGLGAMGGRMANRLLDKGHAVTGYNRTRSKAQWLIDRGMTWGDSPRAVAQAADVIFVMVTDSKALDGVCRWSRRISCRLSPESGGHRHEHGEPRREPRRGREGPETGRRHGGCPGVGQRGDARRRQAHDDGRRQRATFERIKPILDDIGPKVTHVGDNGLALSLKIAHNLSLAVQMLAFSEGVLLAEKSGIPRDVAVDVLTHSVIGSPMVQYRGPFVLKMPDEAWFNVNMMQKDMLLALEMGRRLDVPLPTTAVTNEFLTAARGMGLAEHDFAVMFRVLAQMSGVS